MRTRAQQIADMERRLAELQAEADRRNADPAYTMPCRTCKWSEGSFCKEPLVMGFEGSKGNMSARHTASTVVRLCGPERALWQPRTLYQRSCDSEWFWPVVAPLAIVGAFILFLLLLFYLSGI